MSNNHDIHQYLVEPDFARWLKETGFDGECLGSYNASGVLQTGDDMIHSNLFLRKQWDKWAAASTFAQAFDFVEEKFNVEIKIVSNSAFGVWDEFCFDIYYRVKKQNGDVSYKSIAVTGFKTKREANIAACNAIKQYVNDLQKDRV